MKLIMKTKTLLVPFLAVFTLLLVGFSSALVDGGSSGVDTTFNGVELYEYSPTTMAGDVGSVVPVRVTFTADAGVSDVRVELEMNGFKDDIEAETSRFDVVAGTTYTKLLSLRLPSDLDDELYENVSLHVDITSKDDSVSATYNIGMQRESYTLDVLSVDYNSVVSAGEVFPVSVVVKNTGFNEAEDTFVVVSIPELGVSARGYAGDVESLDCNSGCDDAEDTIQKTIYLKVPSAVEAGVYDLEVKAYSEDSEVASTQLIRIDGDASTKAMASVKSQDVRAGETKTFDLILVNSGDDVMVYELNSVSGSALTVEVPSVVTVGPKTSEEVPVTVSVADDAEVGTYTFSVNVDGEQVVFGVNVTEGSVSASIVALTVILAVVLVVLLVVLIVLLTRRDQTNIEEVETSYY